MPHFEFIEQSRELPQLHLSTKELKLILDEIKNNVIQGHYKLIEVIRPVRFFSDGIIFEVGQGSESTQVYITDWFIHIIKNGKGFDWRSDAPRIFSPLKQRLSKIIAELNKDACMPNASLRLPYCHEPTYIK